MTTVDQTPATGTRSLLIKNLLPGLPERGKIKIGVKGAMMTSRGGKEFQPPQKLDHFVITTMARGPDGNFVRDAELHKQFGEKPTRLPVRLLFDDIGLNFQSRYACFKGKTLWCSGDGERADRLDDAGKHFQVPCTCERIARDYKGPEKCKINGILSVMIDGAGAIGGVWKFRTTSFNTTVGIMSSLSLLKGITGGVLAGIPLELVLAPKTAIAPDTGAAQTVYVVGLEYRGSVAELEAASYATAMRRAQHHQRIENVEQEARLLIASRAAPGTVFPDEENAEVVEEFYPDQAAEAAKITRETRPTRAEAVRELDPIEQLLVLGPAPSPAPDDLLAIPPEFKRPRPTDATGRSVPASEVAVAEEDDGGIPFDDLIPDLSPKVVPIPLPEKPTQDDWRVWCETARDQIGAMKEREDFAPWREAHEAALSQLGSDHPKAYKWLLNIIGAKLTTLGTTTT